MRWLGAGGDPSLSPSGLEDGKVLLGEPRHDVALGPSLHSGARQEEARLPSFLSKISPVTAEGWRWRCPQRPGTRVPLGGQGGLCPRRG